ncbi:lysylphosphatidylglycerol synthase domain-containing protein [Sphingomonas sp. BAUL-RG-20F-R05-02]|uniref:lysylphosphatidylglycerol synthase domain-containing protein n=1 Tax=Sphingomonas sp. BAUL-RG-20F-R05-02 TaxID=2914830 RepID=UPI001F58DCC4|nr:lysylphosphatidylglycerol synthase domain-containing protein [Sphingomonas sp. BAUL-RG-20F-R05-02]
MNRFARAGLLAATLAGIGVAAWTVDAVGARHVFAAMTAIGWVGMAAFLLCSFGVLLLLGGAWLACAPGEPLRRLPLFIWARTAREAATDVLPFSQLGGLVVGARTLGARGVRDSVVYASMVADMTTEMAAQLLFTIGGVATLLAMLTAGPETARIAPLAIGGLGVMALLMIVFVAGQRPVLRLVGAIAARMIPGSAEAVGAVRVQLDAVYRQPRRILIAFLLNLAAWLASAASAWVALWFMGSHLPLWAVLAIEALIFTLRSVAFAVPGAIGIQEAAYALIGPIFGLPPTTALALSLLKRARDLMIGVPAIVLWQAGEVGALVAKRRTA